MTEPTTVEEMKALGMVFPGSWVGAVMRIDLDRADIAGFCGSTALLGDDLFLTARHVVDDALSGPGTAAVVVTDPNTTQRRVTVVEAVEKHPSPAVDLAIGKFQWPESTGEPLADLGQWAGWGLAGGWTDVKMFGYPDELVGRRTDIAGYQFDARYLKGHVTRALAPGDLFQVEAEALELSFPIPKGMSGSPLFAESQPGQRMICGIATGSAEVALVRHRTLTELEKGQPIREEVEQRLIEVGVALRTSYYLDWRPDLLDGRKLGDLLLPTATLGPDT